MGRQTFIHDFSEYAYHLGKYAGMLMEEDLHDEKQIHYLNLFREHMSKIRPILHKWHWDSFADWTTEQKDEFDQFGTTLVQLSACLDCLKASLAKT